MSTTPRLGLNLIEDGNTNWGGLARANMNKIDDYPGITVCTSTTRPASPWVGQTIYVSDLECHEVWDGVEWQAFETKADAEAHKADYTHLNKESGIKRLATIIPAGTSAEWDEVMREIGNVLYDPSDTNKPYKLVYSGHQDPYVEDEVYVGYAYSIDGKSWIKGGKLFERASEDPYLVKHNGTYYIYVEDKAVVPFRNIRLFTSTDFTNWTDRGVILDIGTDWEAQDVSSSTVWVEGNIWYMLYEGRASGQGGAIGLATSSDGITWIKDEANPVITPQNESFFASFDVPWATAIVPDDIKKVGNVYQLIIHGYALNKWCPGIMVGYNLSEWQDVFSLPVSGPINHMMYTPDNLYIYEDETGIQIGAGIENYASIMQFGNRPYVSAANKTYYIDAVSGSDDNDGLSAATAFKTWAKTETLIPIFIRHSLEIRIIGNLPEVIKLRGRVSASSVVGHRLTIRGNTDVASSHVVNGIEINSVLGTDPGGYTGLDVKHLQINGPVIFAGCVGVTFESCNPRNPGGIGIAIRSCVGIRAISCAFGTNVVQDGLGAINSRVLSRNNIGNCTRYGLLASEVATIGKGGTQPTGTTANEYISEGGVIR